MTNVARQSTYSDPFFDILQVKFPSDSRKSLVDEELQNIYDTFEFPNLQPHELQTISERLSSGSSYNQAISGTSYQFPFRPSALLLITKKCRANGQTRTPFAICFILHSYVSFCILYEKNLSIGHLPSLLKCLNAIINVSQLAVRAFIRCLSYYAHKRDFYQFKIYLPQISKFFRTADLKNVVAFDVFADLLKGLTNNGQNELSEDGLELLTLISSMAEERNDVFPQGAAIKILSNLMNLITAMDFHVLDMASHLGPLLGHQYVSELCQLLLPIIVKKITQETPIIEINPKRIETLKFEKPEQILSPLLCFKDDQTFSGGFNVVSRERLPEKEDIISMH